MNPRHRALLLLLLSTAACMEGVGTTGPATPRSSGPLRVQSSGTAADLLRALRSGARASWNNPATCYVAIGESVVGKNTPVIFDTEPSAEAEAFCDPATHQALIKDRALAVEEWRTVPSLPGAKIHYYGPPNVATGEKPAQALTGSEGPASELLTHLRRVSRRALVVIVLP
jgi:hypothetical protein